MNSEPSHGPNQRLLAISQARAGSRVRLREAPDKGKRKKKQLVAERHRRHSTRTPTSAPARREQQPVARCLVVV
eukprot:scaffold10267_cov116-Isochrysis_galbana.AAC.11